MRKLYLQEKLVGEPGQVVGFDADGRAVAEDNIGHGDIKVNLHDNWYFRAPINQRGKTSYTATGYTIDRWIISNPGQGITLGSNGITIKSAGAEWSQRMDHIAFWQGQTVTISMLLADGTFHTGTLETINWVQDTPQTVFDDDVMSCTITQIDTDVCEVTYTVKADGLVLVAAKMELGTTQTLARQKGDNWVLNDTPPNFATERVKCRRYLRVYSFEGAAYTGWITGSSKNLWISGPSFEDMRVKPTPSIDNVKATIRTINGYSSAAGDNEEDEWGTVTNLYISVGQNSYIMNFKNQTLGPNNTPVAVHFRAGKLILDAQL